LKDSAIVKKAVAALDIAPKDRILEIGPGKGIITAELAVNAHNVTVIEIDNSFNQYLVGFPKVKIIYGNALEEIKHVKFDKLISNIPFSISEPLLKRLMHIDFKIAVLFISKSFYELTDKNSRWAVIMPIFFEVIRN
jgi:16S rRNA (adenine1518-N6/adenine1519-N6)-dimethyltransferase